MFHLIFQGENPGLVFVTHQTRGDSNAWFSKLVSSGLLEFLAGLELDTVWPNRSVRFQTKFWSTEFGPLYLVHKFWLVDEQLKGLVKIEWLKILGQGNTEIFPPNVSKANCLYAMPAFAKMFASSQLVEIHNTAFMFWIQTKCFQIFVRSKIVSQFTRFKFS